MAKQPESVVLLNEIITSLESVCFVVISHVLVIKIKLWTIKFYLNFLHKLKTDSQFVDQIKVIIHVVY